MKRKIITFIFFYNLFFMLSCFAFDEKVKVGLLTSNNSVKVGINSNGYLINLKTNNSVLNEKIHKKEVYVVSNKNGLITIFNKTKNKNLGAFTGPLLLKSENPKGLVFCNSSWYRGELLILTNGSKNNITIVNHLYIEDYLLSVLPSEMPYKWHSEALKAQAVAARSYTLGYLGRRKDKGYDLESTVEDQVYSGVISEKKSTANAVRETVGEVLLDYDGKPFIALYHSSAGGFTDSIENVWDKKPSPHILPKPDYDQLSPHFTWSRKYSLAQISNSLRERNLGNLISVSPLERTISNRIKWILISGSNNNLKMRGDEFRRALKLPSSKFNLTNVSKNEIIFNGNGYGHGLGLSQWGAKALAEKGWDYKKILSHYYTDIKLVKI